MMHEVLEPRRLMAGVIRVTSDYGPDHRLLIQGDAAANQLVLTASYAYDDTLPLGETEPYSSLQVYDGKLIINGVEISGGEKHSNPYVSSQGRDSANYYFLDESPLIDLGGGDDVVRLESDSGNYFYNPIISTGRGNDRITADGVSTDLKIGSGDGDDRVTVHAGSDDLYGMNGINGDLDIETGSGNDRIDLLGDHFLRLHGPLRIADNSGRTQINTARVRAYHAATVYTGNAADVINVASTVFSGETTFITRGGNDVVRFRGSVVVPGNLASVLQLGAGRDVFDAEKYYSDFIA